MSGRRQYTVNQAGAPDPETNDGTITIGKQPGEGEKASKPAPKPE